MKTTVELPDPLFHRAKLVAAERRSTLKDLIIEGLAAVTAKPSPRKPLHQLSSEEAEFLELDSHGVPVLKRGKDSRVVVTNEMVDRMREELGI